MYAKYSYNPQKHAVIQPLLIPRINDFLKLKAIYRKISHGFRQYMACNYPLQPPGGIHVSKYKKIK